MNRLADRLTDSRKFRGAGSFQPSQTPSARCEKRVPDESAAGEDSGRGEGRVPQPISHSRFARRLRRFGAAALTALATAVPAQAASAACDGADEVPGDGAQAEGAAATVCVLNEARSRRGLPTLRAQGQLQQAGAAHARDMVRRRYFSHTSPEGRTFDERLRGSYIRGRRWGVGETLAWGTRSKATPAAIVAAWLDSPSHRRIVLGSRFRDVGIGVMPGTPVARDAGATYAAELGVRR